MNYSGDELFIGRVLSFRIIHILLNIRRAIYYLGFALNGREAPRDREPRGNLLASLISTILFYAFFSVRNTLYYYCVAKRSNGAPPSFEFSAKTY